MEKKRKIKILLIELLFVLLVITFDQITKLIIYHPIKNSGIDIILIKGVLRFTWANNTGASFGIFEGKVMILAVISTIAILGFLVFGIFSVKEQNKWYRSGLVLVIAGGLGNIIDRFAFQYVRDFVYFELIDFAVFNFADSALTIGTVCLIIYLLFYYDKENKKNIKVATEPTNNDKTDNITTKDTEISTTKGEDIGEKK